MFFPKFGIFSHARQATSHIAKFRRKTQKRGGRKMEKNSTKKSEKSKKKGCDTDFESIKNLAKKMEVNLSKNSPIVNNKTIKNDLKDLKQTNSVKDLNLPNSEENGILGVTAISKKAAKIAKKIESLFKSPTVTFKDVAGIDDKLEDLLDIIQALELDPHSTQRAVLITGPQGSGKTLIVHALAGELGWPMLEITSTDVVSGVSGESETKLKFFFDQTTKLARKCILFVDNIEVLARKKEDSSSGTKGMESRIISQFKIGIRSLIDSKVLFIAATNDSENMDINLRSMFYEVSIGVPNEISRHKILEKMVSTIKTEDDLDLKRLAHVTPSFVGRDFDSLRFEAIKIAFRRTIAQELPNEANDLSFRTNLLSKWNEEQYANLTNVKIGMDDFIKATEKVQPIAKREGFASVPDVTWEDVGGLEEVRKEIETRILCRVQHPDKAKAYNLQAPTGILLCGPPGCGKTLVAKAMANQAGINFISVKGPELINMVSTL